MLQLISIYQLRGLLRKYDENKTTYERYIFPITHLFWEPYEIQSFRALVTQIKDRIGGPDFDDYLNDEEQFALVDLVLRQRELMQDVNDSSSHLFFRLRLFIGYSQLNLLYTLKHAGLFNISNLQLMADSQSMQRLAELHLMKMLNYVPRERNEFELMNNACRLVANEQLLNQTVFENLLKKIKNESPSPEIMQVYVEQIVARAKLLFKTSMQSLKAACLFSIFHHPTVNAAVLAQLAVTDCPPAREMMKEYQQNFRLI